MSSFGGISSGGISFSGLASGLDTRAIINALLQAESRPMESQRARQADFRARSDLFGRLGSLLSTLQDSAAALTRNSTFDALTGSSSAPGRVGVSVGEGAVAGNWTVEIERLAARHVLTSNGYAAKDTALFTADTLRFVQDGNTIDVAVAGTTLQDVADAINADTTLAVTARIVDTGDGADPYKLVLESDATGAAQEFTVESVGGGLATLVEQLGTNVASEAQDALVRVDGVEFRRATNTLSGAITGVTLDLLEASASTVEVTVTADRSTSTSAAKDFVAAYNAVVDFIATHGKTAEDPAERGALAADPLLRSIRDRLRTVLGSVVSGTGSDGHAMLALVGFSSATDGRLTLDESEFEAAFDADADALTALFASDDGIATRLDDLLDDLAGTDGLIGTRRDGLTDRIDDLDKAIRRSELRLETLEKNLVARFAALESLLAQLQAQGSALGGFGKGSA